MKARWTLGGMVLALLACSSGASNGNESDAYGALKLGLSGTDSRGVGYRLRNAQLQVYGYPDPQYQAAPYDELISTELDPDAALIERRVVPGFYQITLVNSDWYLERSVPDGFERVGQVVLLSPTFQTVNVYDGGVAQVNLRFGVDGELIEFRSAELQIGIEIERPGENCLPRGFAGFGGFGVPPSPSPGCGAGGAGAEEDAGI